MNVLRSLDLNPEETRDREGSRTSQNRGAEFDVLIGGAGIAAAAVAVRLCSLGFRPFILATGTSILSGVEAIPEVALPLFDLLGMRHILWEANGLLVQGFENHWRPSEPALRPGRWIHVDRVKMAKAAIGHALKCGAFLEVCASLPKLVGSDPICITYGGKRMTFEAAIDATGRSAVWSRPIQRYGRQVADIFTFSPQSSPRGRVVKLSSRWAYQIGLKDSTTVAMLGEHNAHQQAPDAPAREALRLKSEQSKFVGRRPAFPQWSENPLQKKRIAIGDAALAFDPLAGQGIRFALSSAFAAAAVVNTWRNSPAEIESAERFYLEYLAQSCSRHLNSLEQIRFEEPPAKLTTHPLPELVIFSGQTITTDLHVNSRIAPGTAVLLPDGTRVRWVDGVDLLRIQYLAREPVRSTELMQQLASAGVTPIRARALLGWCMRHALISAAATDRPRSYTLAEDAPGPSITPPE